jgi:hypothetical protein
MMLFINSPLLMKDLNGRATANLLTDLLNKLLATSAEEQIQQRYEFYPCKKLRAHLYDQGCL